MTVDELKAWTTELLEIAITWRRRDPKFQPHAILRRQDGTDVLVYLDVPPAVMAVPIALFVQQEQATAVAVMMDTWVADETLTATVPKGTQIRDVPGRSDAMIVLGACPAGRCAITARYVDVAGELVFEDGRAVVEDDLASVRSRFFDLVRWPES
jgi:hypothetical protein